MENQPQGAIWNLVLEQPPKILHPSHLEQSPLGMGMRKIR